MQEYVLKGSLQIINVGCEVLYDDARLVSERDSVSVAGGPRSYHKPNPLTDDNHDIVYRASQGSD